MLSNERSTAMRSPSSAARAVIVAQLPSRVQLFATPRIAACQSSPSLTSFRSLPKFMSVESVIPSNISSSNALFSFCPQSFPASLPGSLPVSQLFIVIRLPSDWSFCFIISRSNEYSGFISFRIDWSDLLAVQGTLKSLL